MLLDGPAEPQVWRVGEDSMLLTARCEAEPRGWLRNQRVALSRFLDDGRCTRWHSVGSGAGA